MQNSQSLPKRDVFQRRRIAPLFILLLLDGFMLGGCVTSWMVRNLLGEKCCSSEPMVVSVYNLLDYLIPYYAFFGLALIGFAVLTLLVWKASTSSRSTGD